MFKSSYRNAKVTSNLGGVNKHNLVLNPPDMLEHRAGQKTYLHSVPFAFSAELLTQPNSKKALKQIL